MAVTPESRLEKAANLLESENEEDWRSAAHAAYYACYYLATKIQEVENTPVYSDTGLHQGLIDGFADAGKPRLRKIAIMLGQLKQSRVAADYNPDEDFPQPKAETAVATANRLRAYILEIYKF